MSDLSKISNFVKLVIATIKGDEAEATALKIQKKATAALRAQIAVKQSTTLTLEDTVESAVEALASARINNGNVISDNTNYIHNLLRAKTTLDAAEIALEDHLETIAFLQAELKQVEA